jgi:hypothetical protein
MAKHNIFPIIGGVARLAILRVMVGRGCLAMASSTVGIPFMVEGSRLPRIDRVAAAALAFVMVNWRGRLMASRAIGIPRVVKREDVPILYVGVATDTSTFIMAFRRDLNMAALAFGDGFMVVAKFGPLFHIGMAQHTFPGIVWLGQGSQFSDNGRVARFTFTHIFMAVGKDSPVVEILMAGLAGGAGVVGLGELVDNGRVARFTFSNANVVKIGHQPISSGVATVARASKMVGIKRIFRQRNVAGAAFARRIGVFASGMASIALQVGVAAGE